MDWFLYDNGLCHERVNHFHWFQEHLDINQATTLHQTYLFTILMNKLKPVTIDFQAFIRAEVDRSYWEDWTECLKNPRNFTALLNLLSS